MKNGIPSIYWTFRMVWTFAHFLIVAAAAAVLLTWALTNHNAERAFEPAKDNVLELQQRVSNIIPWPWATDGDSGGSSSESEDNSQSDNYGQQGSTMTIEVDTNVNVRKAPNPDAKVVKVLQAGSSVEADCRTEGAMVDSGPRGSTSRWDHIVGLGYISDAFVPTVTDPLPSC